MKTIVNYCLQVVFSILPVISCFSAERPTSFSRIFSSGVPEIQQQLDLQRTGIQAVINDVDIGRQENAFGLETDGIRLGLFILDPGLTSPVRIYSAVVLRNDSAENFTYNGLDYEILEISATSQSGEPLSRTARGTTFGGPLARRGSPGGGSVRTIPSYGQVVFEVNLAELFVIPADQMVTFWAVARPQTATGKVRLEARSGIAIVNSKVEAGVRSIYDRPIVPARILERMKTVQTNMIDRNSNIGSQMAQSMATMTSSPFYSNHHARLTAKEIPRVAATNVVGLNTATNATLNNVRRSDPDNSGMSRDILLMTVLGLGLFVAGWFFVRRR